MKKLFFIIALFALSSCAIGPKDFPAPRLARKGGGKAYGKNS